MIPRLTLLALLLAPVWAPAQDGPATVILITDATVWDGTSDTATPGLNVLVENNLIRQISAEPIAVDRSANTSIIDAGGRCIEHGFLIEEKTIKVVIKDGEIFQNNL